MEYFKIKTFVNLTNSFFALKNYSLSRMMHSYTQYHIIWHDSAIRSLIQFMNFLYNLTNNSIKFFQPLNANSEFCNYIHQTFLKLHTQTTMESFCCQKFGQNFLNLMIIWRVMEEKFSPHYIQWKINKILICSNSWNADKIE